MKTLGKEKFVKDILAYLEEEMKLEEERRFNSLGNDWHDHNGMLIAYNNVKRYIEHLLREEKK